MRGRITALALLGLLVLAGPGVLLRPVATQPAEKVRRIGLLGTIPPPIFDTFRSTLRDLGWIEGRNLSIERRVAGSDGQLDAQAADLARLKVDVIVAPGPVAVRAARAATSTTPIVMIAGGNVTGFTVGASTEVLAKWIELLRDAVPTTPRIALLVDRHQPAPEREANLQRMEAAARSLRIPLQQFLVGGPDQFESALTAAVASGSRAMAVMTTPMLDVNQERIIALTLRHRLPSIAFFGHYATAGGLISYGPDLHSLFRATAAYVDRILKGVSAGDLPVQQPPQPRLVLNLKTAQALGLALPPSLLLRADQVIE
jgi:putative ABC transport system substrate-binding protein